MLDQILEDMDHLSPDIAARAFCLSIREAVVQYYKVNDCLVDLGDKTVNIVFRMPEHKRHIDTFETGIRYVEKDIVPITLDFASLPKQIVNLVRPLLIRSLSEIAAGDTYATWKKRRNHLTEGVIHERSGNRYVVNLNGMIASFEKRHWIQRELSLYRPGMVLIFHIISVKRTDEGAFISLSRRSKSIPQLLLLHFSYDLISIYF